MRQLPILPFFVGIACALAAAFRQPDEAMAVIPGWHTVVFPSYFQAGAVLSGLAFLQIGLLLARRFFSPVKQYITIDRIESLNATILGAGTLVLLACLYHFFAWGAPAGTTIAFYSREYGMYTYFFTGILCLQVIGLQLFWSRNVRRSIRLTFGLCLLLSSGHWIDWLFMVIGYMYRWLSG